MLYYASSWLFGPQGFVSNGVSICVITQIFRGQITRKIRDFYKEFTNFSGNLPPKNSGHDADWDTISSTKFKACKMN